MKVPAVWQKVKGRSQLLNLIALNLLQNAVKYRRKDVSPIVTISQSAETVHGREMIVTRFRDNGNGLKQEDLARVFQPFVRAISGGPAKKGFGLGLTLVSKAVKSVGGSVWAELPQDDEPGAVFAVALEPGA